MFTVQLLSIICIISLVLICSSQNEGSNNSVLVLYEDNINDTISENKNIFISFYASWCKYSILAAPEYEEAAKKALELELPVTFAQIESTGKTKLFRIDGFPTYKLFRRGVPLQYEGERKSKNFVKWLQDNLGLIKTLNTTQEANELIAAEQLVVFGFFKHRNSKEAQVFENMTDHFSNTVFAITSNEDIFEDYNVTDNSVLLFSKYSDEPLVAIEKLTIDNVQSVIETEQTPNLIEIDHDSIIQSIIDLLKRKTKIALILVSKKDDKTRPLLQITRMLAKEYKDQILFMVVDVDKEYLEPIYSNLNVTEFPSFVLEPNLRHRNSTYKISGNLTLPTMKLLLSYLEEGTIDDVISEKPPKDWDKKPVYTLVKSNFLNVTHDTEKSVLVYFYTDQAPNQSLWRNIIKKVGETVASEDGVIISEIHTGLNGIEEKWYDTVPSIALFRKDDNQQIFYRGKPEVEDVVKFVKSEGVYREEE